MELLVCLLVELHVRPQEPGYIDVQILVLVLDDLVDFVNQLLRRAFQVQLHGASGLLLGLEFGLLRRIRRICVLEPLDLLELLLVGNEGLVTDCFPLLSILDLVAPAPERLVI